LQLNNVTIFHSSSTYIDQRRENVLKRYEKLKREEETAKNVKMLVDLNKDSQNDPKRLTMSTGDPNE